MEIKLIKLRHNVNVIISIHIQIYGTAEFLLNVNIRKIVKKRCDLSIRTDEIAKE